MGFRALRMDLIAVLAVAIASVGLGIASPAQAGPPIGAGPHVIRTAIPDAKTREALIARAKERAHSAADRAAIVGGANRDDAANNDPDVDTSVYEKDIKAAKDAAAAADNATDTGAAARAAAKAAKASAEATAGVPAIDQNDPDATAEQASRAAEAAAADPDDVDKANAAASAENAAVAAAVALYGNPKVAKIKPIKKP